MHSSHLSFGHLEIFQALGTCHCKVGATRQIQELCQVPNIDLFWKFVNHFLEFKNTKNSFGNFNKYSPTSFYHYKYPIEGCFILQKQIESKRRKKERKMASYLTGKFLKKEEPAEVVDEQIVAEEDDEDLVVEQPKQTKKKKSSTKKRKTPETEVEPNASDEDPKKKKKRKSLKDKYPGITMPRNAFQIFRKDQDAAVPEGEKKPGTAEIAQRWKSISDEIHQKYKELAAEDKLRYKNEVIDAGMEWLEDKPKEKTRPDGVWIMFTQDRMKEFREKHPELSYADAIKQLSAEWKGNEALQAPYKKRFAEEKAKFDAMKQQTEQTAVEVQN